MKRFQDKERMMRKITDIAVMVLRFLSPGRLMLPPPPNDEWFTLRVDNNINPMDVVAMSVSRGPRGWKYLGPAVAGKQTYHAKLVCLGACRNLAEARERAEKIGCRLLEGQAREPFKKRFSAQDNRGPIVFGGSVWESPEGNRQVAALRYLPSEWDSSFGLAGKDDHFGEECRWVVASTSS